MDAYEFVTHNLSLDDPEWLRIHPVFVFVLRMCSLTLPSLTHTHTAGETGVHFLSLARARSLSRVRARALSLPHTHTHTQRVVPECTVSTSVKQDTNINVLLDTVEQALLQVNPKP